MSKLSPNGTTKPGWENRKWQPALSLHVLPDQEHSGTEGMGLSRSSPQASDPAVCGRDEPAPDCPSSWLAPSDSLLVGQSTSCAIARSTGTCRSQRSGDGRVIQLHWREKNQIFVITIVDRLTRCYLGFRLVWQRTQDVIQELVDEAPKAKRYYSDAFETYDRLWYHWGVYEVSEGKTDTYSVEGDNAELRHYLARLARRSRCFSRCPEALKAALKLFMYCFNRRQLHKQCFPNYPAHVFQFT